MKLFRDQYVTVGAWAFICIAWDMCPGLCVRSNWN